jgi:hypothetical protein
MASGHGPELKKGVNVPQDQSCRGWKSENPKKVQRISSGLGLLRETTNIK